MERRLLLAKELLNPDDSVLIVTIDEKEYLRLGLLLEQTFPDATIQMVTIGHQPERDVARDRSSRASTSTCSSCSFGDAELSRLDDDMLGLDAEAPTQVGRPSSWEPIAAERRERASRATARISSIRSSSTPATGRDPSTSVTPLRSTTCRAIRRSARMAVWPLRSATAPRAAGSIIARAD